MPEILLIQPPIADFYLTAKRTQPYGLAVIAAALRQRGFTVEILDALATSKQRAIAWPEEMAYLSPFFGRPDRSPFGLFHRYRHFGYSIEHIARLAELSGAFLIGISSLFTAYSDMALKTARAVKKACPHAWLVLGGHHPTAQPDAVMAFEHVDYVIRGDGEVALPQLAEALKGRRALDTIPGLVRRRRGGSLAVAPPAVNQALDALPTPAFDLISWSHYRRSGRGSLSLAATRGCPQRCTYCAVNAASYHGHRQRSVRHVLSELDAAFAHTPIGFVDFEDEHLGADRRWFMALMTGLQRRHARWRAEIRAMNGLFAPALDNDMLAAMPRAGFRTVNLALITTDAGQLRRFARHDSIADVNRVIAACEQLGMQCVAYLIAAGPGQEPLQSVEDLLYLACRRVLAGVSIFYPAPGSADYQWCRRNGRLPSHSSTLRSTAFPLEDRTSRTQAVTLLRLGRILNFMKRLIDAGEPLPPPGKPPQRVHPSEDRFSVGRRLLSALFHDAAIYGVDDDGRLYRHRADASLTRRFLSGIQEMTVRGVLA